MPTSLYLALFLFLLSAGLSYAGPMPSGCSVDNVQLSDVKMTQKRGGHVQITGKVEHTCAGAVGVQLKWTVFYADGSVAFSQDFWAARTSNIPANSEFYFDHSGDIAAKPDTWTLTADSVKVW
jgi:hypothetical protein